MPRAKAAQRVAAQSVTATLAALLSPARAEASRKNGAKSQGPKTATGKARSSHNALKHGLRAEKFVVVEGESAEAFAAFEAALLDDLAPAAGSRPAGLAPRQPPSGAAPAAPPNEAESRADPGESVSLPRATAKSGRAALLAATALVPPDRRSPT